jgi:hypothetical protein
MADLPDILDQSSIYNATGRSMDVVDTDAFILVAVDVG